MTMAEHQFTNGDSDVLAALLSSESGLASPVIETCPCPGCGMGVHEHLEQNEVLPYGAVATIPHTYGYWTTCLACK